MEEQGRSGNRWAPLSAGEMSGLLSARRWLRREAPFPHVIACDVFDAAAYAAIESEFLRHLHPEGAASEATHFGRTLPCYDATAYLFHPRLDGPLRLFLSRGFRDLVAMTVGVNVTHHVSGGLHHHARGSAPGTIHTDLNPAWFVEYDSADGIVVADHSAVRYATGEARRPGVRPNPYVRAVAVLFYLANPPWRPGDGGETGLYDRPDADVCCPAATVAPRNNSLVAFEVTPHSFHAFLPNHGGERNCVAMWLHRSRADVLAQWGGGVIENDSPRAAKRLALSPCRGGVSSGARGRRPAGHGGAAARRG